MLKSFSGTSWFIFQLDFTRLIGEGECIKPMNSSWTVSIEAWSPVTKTNGTSWKSFQNHPKSLSRKQRAGQPCTIDYLLGVKSTDSYSWQNPKQLRNQLVFNPSSGRDKKTVRGLPLELLRWKWLTSRWTWLWQENWIHPHAPSTSAKK